MDGVFVALQRTRHVAGPKLFTDAKYMYGRVVPLLLVTYRGPGTVPCTPLENPGVTRYRHFGHWAHTSLHDLMHAA